MGRTILTGQQRIRTTARPMGRYLTLIRTVWDAVEPARGRPPLPPHTHFPRFAKQACLSGGIISYRGGLKKKKSREIYTTKTKLSFPFLPQLSKMGKMGTRGKRASHSCSFHREPYGVNKGQIASHSASCHLHISPTALDTAPGIGHPKYRLRIPRSHPPRISYAGEITYRASLGH